MMRRTRSGFTLPEALIAGALFLVIAGAFWFTWAGARREEEMASVHLSMLESAAVAMQALRTDLREMVVVSTVPTVDGTSLRVSASGEALMLRHGALGQDPASPCLVVQYDLVPAASKSKDPRFHLRRTLRTSDGSGLPGGAGAREERVFKTFQLEAVSFNYLPPRAGTDAAQGDDHVIHVTFKIVPEVGDDRSMLLTQVLRFLKPPHPRTFAQPLVTAGLETPPQDVLSAALEPLPALPAIEE